MSRYPNNVVKTFKNPDAVLDLVKQGLVRDLFIVDDRTTCVIKKQTYQENKASLYNPTIHAIYVQAYNRQYLREKIEELYLDENEPLSLDSWLFHNTDSVILKTKRDKSFENKYHYGGFKNQLKNCSEILGYSAFSPTQYSLLYDTTDNNESEVCHCSGFKASYEDRIAFRDFEDILKSVASGTRKESHFYQSRKRRKTANPYKCTFSFSSGRISKKRFLLPGKLFTIPFGMSKKIRNIIENELTSVLNLT